MPLPSTAFGAKAAAIFANEMLPDYKKFGIVTTLLGGMERTGATLGAGRTKPGFKLSVASATELAKPFL